MPGAFSVAGWLPYGGAACPAAHFGRMGEASVTRGDHYVKENFDNLARDWRQGDPGQPLYSLVGGDAEPASGLCRSSTSETVLECWTAASWPWITARTARAAEPARPRSRAAEQEKKPTDSAPQAARRNVRRLRFR